MNQTHTPDLTVNDTISDDAELHLRAAQITPLSWAQHKALREALISAGFPPEVASTTPLLAANPQHMLEQLKRRRPELLAPGVIAESIHIDVLVAGLVRAPENLRMDEQRWAGGFKMPRYTTYTENGTAACMLDLADPQLGLDKEKAAAFFFDQIKLIDAEIELKNKYGADICAHGIRIGGTLFPALLRFPGRVPIGGLETGDCYGRTYFVQEKEGMTASKVLSALEKVPTNATELREHPLQKHRASLLTIAGKITAPKPSPINERERLMLVRAVMPATKIVLKVKDVSLVEARRRIVAQHHIEQPTPFSSDTAWQIRAEAVLDSLQAKGYLKTHPGIDAAETRRWLDNPTEIPTHIAHRDDIAALGAATLLLDPDTTGDRHITAALRTRGVFGRDRTRARSFLAAAVIARAVPGHAGRQSALERALNAKGLRDMGVDTRPIDEILVDARSELADARLHRARGNTAIPPMGPATQQIALRGAFYLTCGTGDTVLLERSALGAGKGEGQEPGQLLASLAATRQGLEQLAQAIFDGRRSHPVRRLEKTQSATDQSTPPPTAETMTALGLRALALTPDDPIEDPSASAMLTEDGDELRREVAAVTTRLETMEQRRDDGATATVIQQRGWKDPHSTIAEDLENAVKLLRNWEMRHEILGQSSSPDLAYSDADTTGADL
ncbi:hypothetical protein [Streptomyces sp. AC555_RSS877]|uniref:hypothetical protein n=1 Tax=Streptomyces sp. AC555_RSS877 TaxID=2823688 RepID=UPI001C257A97|nr:hypothetical protein [Streptomyces sp. AC555_RSS877]